MKRKTVAIMMSALLAACGGGSGGSGDANSPDVTQVPDTQVPDIPATDIQVPEIGAALPAVVDTATLQVDQNFSFDTARTIDIEFDIEEARGKKASVSICTGYDAEGDAFDVDYDSCNVRGEMNDGVFSHSMQVTNEFDSVVGVVWFQDSAMPPLYQEFHVDDTMRMKGGEMQRTIVWR